MKDSTPSLNVFGHHFKTPGLGPPLVFLAHPELPG